MNRTPIVKPRDLAPDAEAEIRLSAAAALLDYARTGHLDRRLARLGARGLVAVADRFLEAVI